MSRAEEDREVIQALRQAGADLSQPRDVRHFLYVPDEKIATFEGLAQKAGGQYDGWEAAATP